MHRKYIPIYIQQDATLHSLFISGSCCTCFGWYFHPSSGAHTTISTASGICHTVTAICLSRGRAGTVGGVRHPQHTQTGSNSSTIAADSSNGVTNTRCCRYSCMRCWWWTEVTPEKCRAVSRYNKLCKVASCSIYIGLYLRCTDPWTSKVDLRVYNSAALVPIQRQSKKAHVPPFYFSKIYFNIIPHLR